MEFKLQKYTNFLSKMKEKIFVLKNDELRYKASSITEENFESINNLDQYEFSNLNLQKLIENNNITIKSLEENLVITSHDKNDITILSTFINLFNFLKFVYKLNLFYNNHEKSELFKFNIKEYIINLKQYTRNEILIEILNNIKTNDSDINILTEITKNKIITLKELANTSTEFEDLTQKIESDFFEFIEIYKENSKILGCIDINKLQLEENNYNSNSILNENTEYTFSDLISQIEKIKDFYFSFSRLLIETKKSCIDVQMRNKYSLCIWNDIIRKLIFRFIKKEERDSCIRKSFEFHKLEISKLETRHSEVKSNNVKLKIELKEFLKNKKFQIFFCFKCGNLLKLDRKNNSSCKFDTSCTAKSNYKCMKCEINFCTNCVIEISEEKCGMGHLMFMNNNNILMKYCDVCNKFINENSLSCNLCDLFICDNCNETNKSLERMQCNYCNMRLVFKENSFEKCLMCLEFKECPWKCYFCDYSQCVECNWSEVDSHDYCGQLHLMQKFSLNEINCDPNKINSSFIKNSKTKLFANWLCFVKLCSKCGEFLYEEFLYCNRCSFLLCQNCYDKK